LRVKLHRKYVAQLPVSERRPFVLRA